MDPSRFRSTDDASNKLAVHQTEVERHYRGRSQSEIEGLFGEDASDMAVRGWDAVAKRWKTGYRPFNAIRIGVKELAVSYRARPGAIAPRSQSDSEWRVSSLFKAFLAVLIITGIGLVLAITARGQI
jgi:hypothetical protein